MSHSFTHIYIHALIAVQDREPSIDKSWSDELYRYIANILINNGHKKLAINGEADHVHILFGMRPTQSLTELIQMIKENTSAWINTRKKVKKYFSWQTNFIAFSYSHSQTNNVMEYVDNLEEYHKAQVFKYEDAYMFDLLDDHASVANEVSECVNA